MTAPTLAPSAYPPSVDDLIPQARSLAADLGEIPSRNRVMKEYRVGKHKARAILAALTDTAEPPTQPGSAAPPTAVADPGPTTYPGVVDTAVELDPSTVRPGASPLVAPAADPGIAIDATAEADAVAVPVSARRPVVWPVLILCLPAFVAIWAGWVEMGRRTGFGKVTLLPGIADNFQLDTAITLPIGVETYAAYALWVWLSGQVIGQARRFAKWSAIGALVVGAAGQVAYHLMDAAGWDTAPWPITAVVSCIPVAVLGMGAALAHLMHNTTRTA
jgi:hypothetical protein